MKKMKFEVGEILTEVGGAVAGGLAAGFANKLSFSPLIKNGGTLVVGALLPVLMPKNELIKAVGLGMAAVAGQKLIGSFVPSLAGLDDSAVGDDQAIAAVYDAVVDYPQVQGLPDNGGVEGLPDEALV